MNKPHLSPTQIDMFCRCPESYRRRYVEQEVVPPGIAVIQGTTVHRAAAVNFAQKRETRRDMEIREFSAIAAAEFESAAAAGYVLTEEEQGRGATVVLGEAKDTAVVMAEFHGARQAPHYQPVLVEERVRIPLPMASHDLVGVLDLADAQDLVVDFKTGARKKSQADADTSVQLTTYAAAFRVVAGRPASGLRLDTIVRSKYALSRDVLNTQRGPKDLDALAARINAVLRAIQAGVFPPATPGAWWCGPKWCGYWRTCPYVNSERRAAAEGSES